MNIFITTLHEGRKKGPFDLSEIRNMGSQGLLTPNDLYWHEGMPQEWAPLRELKDLNWKQINAYSALHGGENYYNAREYAGAWRRIGAFLLNTFFLPYGVFCIFLGIEISRMGQASPCVYQTFLPPIFLTWWALNFILSSIKGWGTIGQKIFRIRVLRENGGRLNCWIALRRMLLLPLSIISFSGLMMGVFSRKRQCLHDRITKTVMIKLP